MIFKISLKPVIGLGPLRRALFMSRETCEGVWMHYGAWVGVVFALFGLIVLLAATLAIARASFAKTQIEFLRGANGDLQTRVAFLETENDRRNTELQAEKDKVRVLESVVTGKEQLVEIKEMIEAHDSEASDRQQLLFTTLEQAINLLDTNKKLLSAIKTKVAA